MDLHSFSVSTRWANALLLPAAIVASAPLLRAQSEQNDTYMGENPDRYASVRVIEGEATIRKGDVAESLTRGIPIAEGDVVESHGRGVLQLADGTRVAFGSETRFQIATLFSDQDQGRQVLLRLDYGRLRVAVGRESEAQIRIDMPSGSAILSDGSSASFEMEPDRTARVKVQSGRMTFSNEQDKASLLAGERLTVYSDRDRLDRIQNFNTYGGDSFDAWCDHNLEVRRGPSWEKVPLEIRNYSDDLDANGEWVYVNEYQTWCWRPLRVSAEWRPYWQGRWGAYPGGMTWISDEPWGYVTYHHGRWGWGAGLGWYWVPGVYYSPAWVAWQSDDVYFGWAPMGYHNQPATWGYGAWGGGPCWNVVEINFIHVDHIHTHTHREPGVIRTFDHPRNDPPGNRPLSPPWRQGPLVVNPHEFRNPDELHRVLRDPSTVRDRLHAYEQQTGRTIYRRPFTDIKTPSLLPPPAGTPGFEDRSHLRTADEHPILRNKSLVEGPRPLTRPLPPSIHRTVPGPILREQPLHPRKTPSPSDLPLPLPKPPRELTGPRNSLPGELPIRSHGPTGPKDVPLVPSPAPAGRKGSRGTSSQDQPIQPHDTPRLNQDSIPDDSQPPPVLKKKKRPLNLP